MNTEEQLKQNIDELAKHLVEFYKGNYDDLYAYSIGTVEAIESLLNYLRELRQII